MEALGKLIRRGAEPDELCKLPILFSLRCVRARAESDSLDALAEACRDTIREVCLRLEPKERADAALTLFGFVESRWKSARARQEVAGRKLGANWENFRRTHQPRLLMACARGLDRLECRHLGLLRHKAEATREYRWVSKDLTYAISPDDYRQHVFSRSFVVEALEPHVTQVDHYYRWSGSGVQSQPVITSPGHYMLGVPTANEDWMHCIIHFGRELSLGERETVSISQDFFDIDRKYLPFFNTYADSPGMERISLKILLPSSRPPSHVIYSIYGDSRPNATLIRRQEGHYDKQDGVIEWVPTVLQEGYKYSVSWSYSDGSGLYGSELYTPADH